MSQNNLEGKPPNTLTLPPPPPHPPPYPCPEGGEEGRGREGGGEREEEINTFLLLETEREQEALLSVRPHSSRVAQGLIFVSLVSSLVVSSLAKTSV